MKAKLIIGIKISKYHLCTETCLSIQKNKLKVHLRISLEISSLIQHFLPMKLLYFIKGYNISVYHSTFTTVVSKWPLKTCTNARIITHVKHQIKHIMTIYDRKKNNYGNSGKISCFVFSDLEQDNDSVFIKFRDNSEQTSLEYIHCFK